MDLKLYICNFTLNVKQIYGKSSANIQLILRIIFRLIQKNIIHKVCGSEQFTNLYLFVLAINLQRSIYKQKVENS